MRKIITQVTAGFEVGIVVLALLTHAAFAQIEGAAAPDITAPAAQTPETAIPVSATDGVIDTTNAATTPTQETGSPQTTIQGTDLISTADPSNGTTTETTLEVAGSMPPVSSEPVPDTSASTTPADPSAEAGTATPPPAPTPELPPAPDIQPPVDELPPQGTPPAEVPPITPPVETPPNQLNPEPNQTVVATLSLEDLKPEPEFILSVVGSRIGAKVKPSWQNDPNSAAPSQQVATVTEVPQITPDAQSGTLVISGVCQNKYYAIILYRTETDYDHDPASYVVNKSYPCENGSYSYTLDDLPPSLESGTYYLLIAGQGDRGPWKPASAIIPITIAKQ